MSFVDLETFMLLLVLVTGGMVGSFLNVVIHRVPRGESVVTPRSRCPHCQHEISWWENIPVLSWLLLRGRCRGCGQAISFRYVLVEILAALLAVLLFSRFGPSVLFLFFTYFAFNLLALTYIDLDHQLLPDRLTLSGLCIGLVGAPFVLPEGPVPAFLFALQGALVGGGLLFGVAWGYEKATGRQGMGGGDIKFLAMIGAFLGWEGALLALFLGSLAGSLIGVMLMVRRGANRRLALPFGPFLAIGAFVTLFWGPQILQWYFGSLRL
jgi:leader peptidase (prepilin peptidase)/N-methyltransferase